MCPICWATALASFGGLIVFAGLAMAGSDRPTLVMVVLLGGFSMIEKFDLQAIPWWCFVVLIAALTGRVGYLGVRAREQLLVLKIWNRARQVATARCPRTKARGAARMAEV